MEHQIGIFNKHDSNEFLASFSILDNTVSVLPLNEAASDVCRKLSYDDISRHTESWMYGISDHNHAVAVLRRGTVPFALFASNAMTFYTPIVIESIRKLHQELSEYVFTDIQFIGGIIDILYPVEMAYTWTPSEFKIKEKSEFTNSFNVDINGEQFVIEYSIDTKFKHEIGMAPDFSDVHSTITLHFKEAKSFSEIEKYYSYVLSLCQFCSGCQNVCFKINLYNSKDNIAYSTTIPDAYDDNAQSFLHITDVINLKKLDQDITTLLKVLVEEKIKPYLLYLPQRNSEYRSIKYTDVTDMCVAIDREYRLLKLRYPFDFDSIDDVYNGIMDYLNSNGTNPELISRVSGLLGQLRNPSPKAMINLLYKHFYASIEKITDNGIEDELRTIKRYSTDEFSIYAGKFVDIRNKAAHKGIVWNEGISIYNHLRLIIYLSILERSGISSDRSIELIDSFFYRFFL